MGGEGARVPTIRVVGTPPPAMGLLPGSPSAGQSPPPSPGPSVQSVSHPSAVQELVEAAVPSVGETVPGMTSPRAVMPAEPSPVVAQLEAARERTDATLATALDLLSGESPGRGESEL